MNKRQAFFICLLVLFQTSFGAHGQNLYEYYLIKGSSKIVSMDYEGARFYLTKGVDRYPDSADVWYHRGGANYFLLDFDAALIDFNKTLELDPSNEEVYKWRGMIYHQQLNYEAAENDYVSFLKYNPEDVFVQIKRIEVQIEQKDLKKAEKALDELRPEHLQNAHLHNAYGMLYEALGNKVESYSSFTTAITLDENQAIFYLNRGRLLREQERTEEACADWGKAAVLGLDTGRQLCEAANCTGLGTPDPGNGQ